MKNIASDVQKTAAPEPYSIVNWKWMWTQYKPFQDATDYTLAEVLFELIDMGVGDGLFCSIYFEDIKFLCQFIFRKIIECS